MLNPPTPNSGRAVDIAALDLQAFGAGVAVRREQGHAVLVHPLREPARVPKMIAARAIGPAKRWRWRGGQHRHCDPPAQDEWSRRDVATGAGSLRCARATRRVVDRFLAGVLLEDNGATSNAFSLLLARSFVLGVPGLPAQGMRALPRQLVEPLAGRIALNRKVTRVERDGQGWMVRGDDSVVSARDVVVAADPAHAAALTGQPVPRTHGVVTDWWAVSEVPSPYSMLWVDGRVKPRGPVLNTAVISAAVPSYAPPGRHLISASALLAEDGAEPPETVTRRHAADILGGDGHGWELVTRHVIRHALPAQPPPLRVRRSVRVGDGLWWCGDHRDTASIQGALVSGRRTAEALLNERRVPG